MDAVDEFALALDPKIEVVITEEEIASSRIGASDYIRSRLVAAGVPLGPRIGLQYGEFVTHGYLDVRSLSLPTGSSKIGRLYMWRPTR